MKSNRVISWAAFALLAWPGPAAAAPRTFDLAVKKPHLLGASHGTLVVGDQGVEYRTSDKKDARRWTYEQIRELQIASPSRIVVRTYEDQGWTRLWTDRSFAYEVTKGAVTPEVVAFLLDKMPRAVVTAVLPPLAGAPPYRVPVKHVRGRRGSEGDLVLYDQALVYRSPQPGASRFWRFNDIASVLTLDPYRLQVTVYEGGGGPRPFTFELKTPLPPGFYDRLWAFVNAPTPLRQTTGR